MPARRQALHPAARRANKKSEIVACREVPRLLVWPGPASSGSANRPRRAARAGTRQTPPRVSTRGTETSALRYSSAEILRLTATPCDGVECGRRRCASPPTERSLETHRETHILCDPVAITALGVNRVVQPTHHSTHLVQQLRPYHVSLPPSHRQYTQTASSARFS
jgi:hypothetical protein